MNESRRNFIRTCGAAGIGIGFGGVRMKEAHAAETDPPQTANTPVGVAQGIFPGRVTWVRDPRAAKWETAYGTLWWEDRFTDPDAVADMLSRSIRLLTGAVDDSGAWDSLFRYFNSRHGKGDTGYRKGERIAVKINLNQCYTHSRLTTNLSIATPQMMRSIATQLVETVGADPADICFYDAVRWIPKVLYDACYSLYPEIRLVDFPGGDGREQPRRDTGAMIEWSEIMTGEIGASGLPVYVPTCVSEADYLINLAHLKGHDITGVTLTAKNHFGSLSADDPEGNPHYYAPKCAGLHPYIATLSGSSDVEEQWRFTSREMGSYNPIVDLTSFPHLGGKTLLYLMDGLYAVEHELRLIDRWAQWQTFDYQWTSSLFASLDPVAIDSVGVDFMLSEPRMSYSHGALDNYLHEAAAIGAPPSGATYRYAPAEGSLGVHEHWDSPETRRYSRNLGTGNGIELVTPQDSPLHIESEPEMISPLRLTNYPNPFNPSTTIEIAVPETCHVTLDIYTLGGQRVRRLADKRVSAGIHRYVWDGRDMNGVAVAGGVYLSRVQTARGTATRKLILMK